MAKIATRKAKPNGQFWLELKDVQAFILDKPVGDLPGKFVIYKRFDYSLLKLIRNFSLVL